MIGSPFFQPSAETEKDEKAIDSEAKTAVHLKLWISSVTELMKEYRTFRKTIRIAITNSGDCRDLAG